MKESEDLNNPSLVAVWPGMGNVAINAGYYLMAKLGMHLDAELSARELFEINHVEVSRGLIRPGRLPRSRFFIWKDPAQKQDLVVFLGEAQPPTGVYAYCRHIIEYARSLGVQRVFTFAAMATQMELGQASRVFGAATDEVSLAQCRHLEMDILEDGQISGLNGVLLGVAAESGLSGTCLLGEMPHVFTQVAYPKASLAVLDAFRTLMGVDLDLTELERQAEAMEDNLRILMKRIEEAIRSRQGEGSAPFVPQEGESFGPPLEPEPSKPESLGVDDRKRIEDLFAAAERDRAQAYTLKQELDRLKVFDEYEDRFLDLFTNSDDGEGGEAGRKDSAA